MASSSSSILASDDEMVMGALFDAFQSKFSMEEIASAYIRAGSNPDVASDILLRLEKGVLNVSKSECSGAKSSQKLPEYNARSNKTSSNKNSKGSKPKKVSISIGTVSSVIGRSYVNRSSSPYDLCKGSKPLKFELKESSTDVPVVAHIKEPINKKDVDEFLFTMLGEGFRLQMGDIQKVLGSCGYDAKKSMERLLDMRTTALDKGKGICDDVHLQLSDMSSKESQSSLESSLDEDSQRNSDLELHCEEEKKYNQLREVSEALFNLTKRDEMGPKKNQPKKPVKRARAVGKLVTTPLEDNTDSSHSIQEPEQVTIDDDEYEVLRRASKENWDAMKAYYEAALEAYLEGDGARATYLVEEGKIFYQKARDADERSAREIVKTRDADAQNVVTLDLHDHDPKYAIRLLKSHINHLAGIPSFQFLKLVLESDNVNSTSGTGAQRRQVTKFLQKENIKWVEEESSKTILIRVDEINPDGLSFAKKMQ